jgi:hypothetical protein
LEPQSCYKRPVSARKKSDKYGSEMACQFIVIDDLPDGDYILEATVNAPSVEMTKNGKGKVLFEEDNYDNDTVTVRLEIKGDRVVVIKENYTMD